jgi:protein phosphatase PTC7
MTIVCMVLSTLVLGRMVRQARATAGRPTVPVNKAAGRTRRRPWRDVLRAPQPQKLGAKEDGFRREVGKQLPELVAIDGCEIRHHVMELTVSQAAPPWRIGVRSVSGQVRSANEDFARGFVLGDAAALIIGDGCGGVPHGAHASHLAVRAARDSLVSELAERGAECAGHAIAVAFDAATQRLAGAASQIGDDRLNGGLRTTLIVVVGTATEYHWGYIGDGGMVLRRADGTCAAILKPQRGAASNILAASLGPQIAGRPCFGTIARRDGDLLLVGTDGVFDHLCEDFPGQVLKLAINRGGNLDMAAEEVLRGFADEQDEFGYLCDDNLTLGLMMNGQPDVGREFWDLAQRAPNAATT